ncbi:MAG: ABC transporter permease [Acidimicrobiia bacterium]
MSAALRPIDAVRVGAGALGARTGRTILTALGIAVGIAALVAVVGISSSSRADLLAQLDRYGTNLLEVQAGQSVFGDASSLPADAPSMIDRIAPVDAVSATAGISGASVRRNNLIPSSETGGIAVQAASLSLPDTVGATVAQGRFLDEATESLPSVVLGSTAARRLGITSLRGSPTVWINGRWWAVIGILDPVPLLASLDSSALIGFPAAADLLDHDGKVSSIFVRADPRSVESVRSVLAATTNPSAPNEVSISRPSDALKARAAVDSGLRALLLALGGVSLLVGGIGIANVMVISVLERRTEIGVRRAIGATRRHIRLQFMIEAATLATLGGVGGVVIGSFVTTLYARREHVPTTIPLTALCAAVLAALMVGVVAGLFPAVRASRLDPAEALRPS